MIQELHVVHIHCITATSLLNGTYGYSYTIISSCTDRARTRTDVHRQWPVRATDSTDAHGHWPVRATDSTDVPRTFPVARKYRPCCSLVSSPWCSTFIVPLGTRVVRFHSILKLYLYKTAWLVHGIWFKRYQNHSRNR